MGESFDLRAGAATIVVDEGRYAGLEVVVQLDGPYRVRREAARLWAEFRAADGGSEDEAAAIDALYALMAGEYSPTGRDEDRLPAIVLSWNLVMDGVPVPVTAAGLHLASLALNTTILAHWFRYAGMVMPPLPPSSPGTPSEHASTDTPSSAGSSPDGPSTTEDPSTP